MDFAKGTLNVKKKNTDNRIKRYKFCWVHLSHIYDDTICYNADGRGAPSELFFIVIISLFKHIKAERLGEVNDTI